MPQPDRGDRAKILRDKKIALGEAGIAALPCLQSKSIALILGSILMIAKPKIIIFESGINPQSLIGAGIDTLQLESLKPFSELNYRQVPRFDPRKKFCLEINGFLKFLNPIDLKQKYAASSSYKARLIWLMRSAIGRKKFNVLNQIRFDFQLLKNFLGCQ
jgi:hypothetical protein